MACLNTPLMTHTLSKSAPCLLLWKTIWNGKGLSTSSQGIPLPVWYEKAYWIAIGREINSYVIGCSHWQNVCFWASFMGCMMWRVFSGSVSVVEFSAWHWFISICWTLSSPARFIKLSSDCEWTRKHLMHYIKSTCRVWKWQQNWHLVYCIIMSLMKTEV